MFKIIAFLITLTFAPAARGQQPTPKLFVIPTTGAACQWITSLTSTAGNCQPSILAIAYEAPPSSAIRFTITYTAMPSGVITTVTQTSDVDISGVATFNLRPGSDFAANPRVTAMLLLPAGSTEN